MAPGAPKVSPFVNVKQMYDSNIFMEPDAKDDHITVLSPGVNLEASSASSELSLNYRLDRFQFWNNTRENITGHTILTTGNLRPSRDWSVGFHDRFERTADPATIELTERQERITNKAYLRNQYDIDSLSLKLEYANFLYDYDDFDFLDRQSHVVSVAAYYRYLHDLPFFIQYDREWLAYREEGKSDADYGALWGGIEGKLGRELTGEIKAGYLWQDYEQLDRDDFGGGGFYAALRHDFSVKGFLKALVTRRLEESAYKTNDYYLINGGALELNRKLKGKLSLVLFGSYYNSRYPTETTEGGNTAKRNDDIFTGLARLEYDFSKRLAASAGYSFNNRSSNMEVFEFARHRVSIETVLKF